MRANSSSCHPTPTPKMLRPPERRSSVAHSLAKYAGLRSGSTSTIVPSLMVRVTPASAASSATGSSHVQAYAGGVSSRWSMLTAQSKPRSSARRR